MGPQSAGAGLHQLQGLADASPQVAGLRALQARATVQQRSDGLGAELTAGVEALSGVSMEGVRVHRNSPEPAAIGALAYAQGRDIHLGPGQEQHLPHEAWHVAQQARGRVQPTGQVNGVAINDNAGLEHEADVMGARALQHGASLQRKSARAGLLETPATFMLASGHAGQTPFQRQVAVAAMDAELGTQTSVMTRAQYQNWRLTAQARFGQHGTAPLGDRVVVTQLRPDGEVLQGFFLSKSAKGKLVAFEGALTFIAGIAAIAISSGALAVPGIIAAVVGFIKFCRGIATWKFAEEEKNLSERELMEEEYKKKAAVRTRILDGVRTLEAALAILGGVLTGNPAVIVFGVAKAVRAVCTAITDYMGENTEHKVLRKFLLGGAALAHAVEVAALGFAGGAAIGGAVSGTLDSEAAGTLVLGVSNVLVGGAKDARAADQTLDAMEAPTSAPASGTRDRSPSYATPPASVNYVT